MNDLGAMKDKYYALSQKVLEANNTTSFTGLVDQAYKNLHEKEITDPIIDKVLMEFAPYFKYWEFRHKEELLDRVINNE